MNSSKKNEHNYLVDGYLMELGRELRTAAFLRTLTMRLLLMEHHPIT